jgi:hypothetical protein
MLSSHRPFLGLFLFLGAPVVYQSRSWVYDYPLKELQPRPRIWTTGKRAQDLVITTCQYGVALFCMTNVLLTSWQLGHQTVVVRKCSASYLPFLYSIFPVVIHLVGAGSWYLSKNMKSVRKVTSTKDWACVLGGRSGLIMRTYFVQCNNEGRILNTSKKSM